MSARTQIADLLKGIAVLLMIQVHIIELFADTTIFNSDLGKILLFLGGPPVAPVFMLILGYFIASSKKTTIQLIGRGLKIIGLGMLLNIAMNLNLIISVGRDRYQIDLWSYLFGVDILQFAGLSIIVIALLKRVFEKSIWIIIAGIIISGFLGKFLLHYIPENTVLKYISALFYGSTYWSYFPLFPWLAYPLAGMTFYNIKQRINFSFLFQTKFKLLIAIVGIVFMILTINHAISVSSTLYMYYHHGLKFCLWTILFLSFYSFFLNEINELVGETLIFVYLKWLGKNVTLIYFIQWIIIGNIATEIYRSVSNPLYLALCFIGIVGASSVLGDLILRLKERFVKKTIKN